MSIERPSNILPFRAENSAVEKLAAAVEVRNATEDTAELWLTGEVGWDIYAPVVIDRLRALDGEGKSITIYINSPGGDVFEGYAIGNAIALMKADTTVHVMALAASIASFIAVSADRVVMPANSMMMIHNAWAIAIGEAEDLENTAVLLHKLNAQLAAAYEAKRSRTLGETEAGEDFADLMNKTTWLTAEQAVALGLADEIAAAVKAAASVRPDIAAQIELPESAAELVAEPEEESAVEVEDEAVEEAAASDFEEAAETSATDPANFAARAAADAAISTTTIAPAPFAPAVADRMAELRARQFARFNHRKAG